MENDALKSEVSQMKSGNDGSTEGDGPGQEELMRLRAENTVLHKSLQGMADMFLKLCGRLSSSELQERSQRSSNDTTDAVERSVICDHEKKKVLLQRLIVT